MVEKTRSRALRVQQALDRMAENHVDHAVILSYYTTTSMDWQRGIRWKDSFDNIQHLYDSTTKLGLRSVILYDDDKLPAALGIPTDSLFQLEKMKVREGDSRWQITDLRFILSGRWLKDHPDVDYIFQTDLADVRVGMNPFLHVQPGHIYSGSERSAINGHWFLSPLFPTLGGQYEEWFHNVSKGPEKPLLNAGIIGGERKIMLSFFDAMTTVLAAPKGEGPLHTDMASFNYVLYSKFEPMLVTGFPVHSTFEGYEDARKDVWFIHK